jgi:uncharacterized protein
MLLAAAAALVGASAQSATGFGFALVLSPALFAVLDPYEAVSALLLLGLVLNLLVLADGGLAPVRWRALAPMLVAALPGLALGAALLEALSKPALQVTVGVAVLAVTALQARGTLDRVAAAPADPTLGGGVAAGLSSGVLTTSISISGPPIVLWLEHAGLGPAELRSSLAASFLALNVAGAAVLIAAGSGDMASAGVLAPLAALVVAGHLAGAAIFRRLDPRRFRAAVLGLVACTGVASVVAGAVSL